MYSEVLSDVYSVLSTLSYSTFPSSYQGISGGAPYIISNVLMPSVKAGSYNMCCKEVNGLMILNLYVLAERGIMDIYTMADDLNPLFEWVILPNGTHMQTSSVEIIGHDDADRSLFRADYKVPLTYYGA